MVYEIWIEGYRCTGNYSKAQKLGEGEGNSFKDACDNFFNNRNDKFLYDDKDLTYWGCKIFDNQCEAIKSFG